MARNTINIAKDGSNQEVPGQYYNSAADKYEVTEGNNGAPFVQLTGSNVAENRRLIPVGQPTKMNIPTPDGANQPTHPTVVHMPRGFGGYMYWMAFTPYTNSDNRTENPCIVASNDGVNFVVPAGVTNPLVPAPAEPDFNRDPELVWCPDMGAGRLYMYYSQNSGTYRIYTENGVTWTAPEKLIFTPSPTDVFNAVGILRNTANQWTAWTNSNNEGRRLQKYTSTDGLNWRKVGDAYTNLLTTWHPSVMAEGGGLHFLCSSHPYQAHVYTGECLYYGYSEDGDNIYFDPNPIVIPDYTTSHMSRTIYRASMMRIDSQRFRIYMGMANKNGAWCISYMDVAFNDPHTLLHSLQTPPSKSVTRVLWDAYSLRSASVTHFDFAASKDIPELRRYQNKLLYIRSSLDQPVSLYATTDLRSSAGYDFLRKSDSAAVDGVAHTIAASGDFKTYVLSASDWAPLGWVYPANQMNTFSLKAAVAPTAGNLTIKLVCW